MPVKCSQFEEMSRLYSTSLTHMEWTQFRLHTLGVSMTREEVPWVSFHGRPMGGAFSPLNSSVRSCNRELERALGRKTMEVEILRAAQEILKKSPSLRRGSGR